MSKGFAPATKATITVTKASTRHTAVTGGMSPGFRVVFLLILLLVLSLLLLAFLRMFLLEMFLLLILVLLRERSLLSRFAGSQQFCTVAVTGNLTYVGLCQTTHIV